LFGLAFQVLLPHPELRNSPRRLVRWRLLRPPPAAAPPPPPNATAAAAAAEALPPAAAAARVANVRFCLCRRRLAALSCHFIVAPLDAQGNK